MFATAGYRFQVLLGLSKQLKSANYAAYNYICFMYHV